MLPQKWISIEDRWFVVSPGIVYTDRPDPLPVDVRTPENAFNDTIDLRGTGLYAAGAIDELQRSLFLPLILEALSEKMANQVGGLGTLGPIGLLEMFGSAQDYIQDQASAVTHAITGPFMWYGNIAEAIWGTYMLLLGARWLIATASSCFFRW